MLELELAELDDDDWYTELLPLLSDSSMARSPAAYLQQHTAHSTHSTLITQHNMTLEGVAPYVSITITSTLQRNACTEVLIRKQTCQLILLDQP